MVFFQSKRVGDGVAFQVVAAGQAQERRLHVRQLLHQVDAVAVGRLLIGRREQRDQVQPDRAGLFGGDHEAGGVVGATLPVVSVTVYCFQSVADLGDGGFGVDGRAVGAFDVHGQRAGEAGAALA